MKFLKKLPVNIFTLVAFLCVIAFCFRVVNILTLNDRAAESVGVIMTATAQEQVSDQPPPLTKEQLEKAVAETARSVNEGVLPATDPAVPSKEPPTAATDPSSFENRAFSAAEVEVLQSLSRRRDELDTREKRISEREALLSAAEREVDRKIAELNKIKGDLESLLGQQQTMEEDRLLSLVKIYEGMKPKEAATIFNTLDMDVLLTVIGRMSERKSSPILAAMEPEKARIVTMRLAEQRTLPEAAPSAKKP